MEEEQEKVIECIERGAKRKKSKGPKLCRWKLGMTLNKVFPPKMC